MLIRIVRVHLLFTLLGSLLHSCEFSFRGTQFHCNPIPSTGIYPIRTYNERYNYTYSFYWEGAQFFESGDLRDPKILGFGGWGFPKLYENGDPSIPRSPLFGVPIFP